MVALLTEPLRIRLLSYNDLSTCTSKHIHIEYYKAYLQHNTSMTTHNIIYFGLLVPNAYLYYNAYNPAYCTCDSSRQRGL